ncbi:MAG: methylcrotonoyl-CoA carboxylase [Phenylobacterium zucineum]|nr:MAG: methylcrotonoyl-CoA carboxylase [Phenylobacterium zucineum]
MFKSVLVANRGEIARRIFRTARRMGIATVAVYSEADAQSAHVREADHAILIGPPAARDSYLRADAVLAAAQDSGAEAIHPGYGFLSENADFAEAVLAAGLIWIGPPAKVISAMGRKDAAKALMIKAGVPVTPGYLGEDQDAENLQAEAARIGYPLLIKAVAGGGGKGMRRVETADGFLSALTSCRREAAAGFGDDRVLIEKYISTPRHIEVQVFGDQAGRVVHLFERDCSLQRRHQKVIEEAPAPGMTLAVREAVTTAAVRAAQAVGYVGAGTIEFIADAGEGLRADRIWFMEMNTRLQVEHPVTEAVTGVDLVEWQFRVAAGERLPLTQDEIKLSGHAIEARLYAENPASGFLPSIGTLEHFQLPDGVRVDSAVEEGDEVSPFYDPMIAKLIAHAQTREGASDLLAEACASVEIWPVKANAGFLARCLDHPDFIAGKVDTGFIENRLADLAQRPAPSAALQTLAAAALMASDQGEINDPWSALTGFRLNAPPPSELRIYVDGEPFDAPMSDEDFEADLLVLNDASVLFEGGEAFAVSSRPPVRDPASLAAGNGEIRSPMPGKVVSVSANLGDKVLKGQVILVLEAMKMEHTLIAPFDGIIEALAVSTGDQVSEGVALARLKADIA